MNEKFLIDYLSKVNNRSFEQLNSNKDKIRALMNITIPNNLSDEFYQKQDEYLQSLYANKDIVNAEDILKDKQIALVLHDITEIKADAIVNACNSQLLGCFAPLHYCIDNAIHSFGGLQIRRDLLPIMQQQNFFEPNGRCKVTKGYNLPSKYVFHTVGPVCNGGVTDEMKDDLKNCYISCLKKADEMQLNNIVFCSLSTGIFGFPIEIASSIAITSVKQYLNSTNSNLRVIFDLFSERDYKIYDRKL